MKVVFKKTIEIDVNEVLSMCVAVKPRKQINRFIRSFVETQCSLRLSEEGWILPTPELIAGNLIEQGYAKGMDNV